MKRPFGGQSGLVFGMALVVAAAALAWVSASMAQEPAAVWDVMSDTWVATDALGRTLPSAAEVGPPRPNKTVGIFYFLWLGRHGNQGPFDISKILADDPTAIFKPEHPSWGPMLVPHHWGESIFDYYVSDDEGVLRKHAQMLGDAGVDVVIFDVTNQFTYPESWKALCKIFGEMRRAGNHVPQIAFLCPFWNSKKVVGELWEQLYSKNISPELWFRWEGKPLILADPAATEDEAVRNFFTFRKPQPDYFTGPRSLGEWGWLEVYPQHPFCKTQDVPEMMTVGVAQNAVEGKLSVLSNPKAHGRSFHDGKEPPGAECDFAGRNFAEQFGRAMKVDPPFLFITGWNEWIAGRFDSKAPFHAPGPVTFVDQFSEEFSRDIEPMKGGHGDNYYYQLAGYVRRYKGARTLEPVKPQPITIDGSFDDWQKVAPEYRDMVGDPVCRDHVGWDGKTRYVDHTGRNDMVAAKVNFDAKGLYFYVRTREAISPISDVDWMMLYIDADNNPKTGWLGYDYVLNRRRTADGKATVESNVDGKYAWKDAGEADFRVSGCEIELSVTRTALGMNVQEATIDFKWADNIQETGDWSDFTLHGDVAPNDRFNFRAIMKP